MVLKDLQAKMRSLHELQHKVLPINREKYFYPNLESYLETATIPQLRTYITTYQPVIWASIRAATAASTLAESTSNYLPAPVPGPILRHTTSHSAMEEVPHRKRNRLRTLARVILWIITLARQ
jgi:hypothetical protein